jgi:hypothetical protein
MKKLDEGGGVPPSSAIIFLLLGLLYILYIVSINH